MREKFSFTDVSPVSSVSPTMTQWIFTGSITSRLDYLIKLNRNSIISVIASNPNMRSTTNLLINNLAIADILFVLFCVPFTASDYVLPNWLFGNFWCKIVN